ncbi:MAG: hypothetical protein K5804_18600, partial [Microbacterium sp.]
MSFDEKLENDLRTAKSKISEIKSKITDLKKNSKLDNIDNKENKKVLQENKQLKKELNKELKQLKKELNTELKEIKNIAIQMKKTEKKSQYEKLENSLAIAEQFSDISVNATQKQTWKGLQTEIKTEFYDAKGNLIQIESEITKIRLGMFDIKVLATDMTRPGLYTLKTTLDVNGQQFISENQFTWGLVTVNSESSIYPLDETVRFDIAVLNGTGNPVCGADISMNVIDPNLSSILMTSENEVSPSSSCGLYHSYFETDVLGNHTVYVKAQTNTGTVDFTTYFLVQDYVEYDIYRNAETKIDPFNYDNEFPVHIEIESFVGTNPMTITEYVPSFFDVKTDGMIQVVNDKKAITWTVTPNEENVASVSYAYSVPLETPQLYALGKIEVKQEGVPLFTEARNWYIAVDPEILIDSSVSTNAFDNMNSGSGSVVVNATSVYQFYIATGSDLAYRYSDDRGQTWGSEVILSAGSYLKLDVWYDKWTLGGTGDNIHVAVIDSAKDSIFYYQFDSVNPPTTSVTLIDTDSNDSSCSASCQGVLGNDSSVAVTVAGDGSVYVATTDDTDNAANVTDVRQCQSGSTCTAVTGWTAAGSVNSTPWAAGADGDDYIELVPLDGTTDDIMLISLDTGKPNDIDYATWDGNTWSSFTEIFNDCDEDNSNPNHLNAISDPLTGDIYMACVDDPGATSGDVKFWTYNGSWTQQTDISDTNQRSIDVALGVDLYTGDIYAIILRGTDATSVDIEERYSSDLGTTWSEFNILTDAPLDFVGVTVTQASEHFLWSSAVNSGVTGGNGDYELVGNWALNRIFLTDSLNLTSSQTRRVTIQKSDSVDVADVISQKQITIQKSDSVDISDSTAKTITESLSDTITATDSTITSVVINQFISDNISVTDNLATQASITQSISDSVTASDNIIISAIITQSLSDNISVTDNLATQASIIQFLSDSVTVT